MNRIGHVVCAMVSCFLIGAGSASAAVCFKDTQYTPKMSFTVSSCVLIGTSDVSSPPSALTGVVDNGTAYFSVAYNGSAGGLRFYQVNVSSLTGTTWGVLTLSAPGTFYDTPHSAVFVSCVADGPAADSGSGSGAPE